MKTKSSSTTSKKQTTSKLGVKLLAISLIALNASCSHVRLFKPKIEGEFCNYWAKDQMVICRYIQTKKWASDKPISEADNYIMLSPSTWESIQNYLDLEGL